MKRFQLFDFVLAVLVFAQSITIVALGTRRRVFPPFRDTMVELMSLESEAYSLREELERLKRQSSSYENKPR